MIRSRRLFVAAVLLTCAVLFLAGSAAIYLMRSGNLRGRRFGGTYLFLLRATGSLEGADLQGADLSNGELRETSLWGADLRGADLRAADLREAGLAGADLRGARLFRARLEGARYDASTRWPPRYDPKSHGAHLVKQ
jgi:hypothetical protein